MGILNRYPNLSSDDVRRLREIEKQRPDLDPKDPGAGRTPEQIEIVAKLADAMEEEENAALRDEERGM